MLVIFLSECHAFPIDQYHRDNGRDITSTRLDDIALTLSRLVYDDEKNPLWESLCPYARTFGSLIVASSFKIVSLVQAFS